MSDLLDMKSAAEYLAIDYETFREYANLGMVAAVRYPSLVKGKKGSPRRKRLFRKETLDKFIAECEQQPVGTKVGTNSRVPKAGNYRKGWESEVSERVLSGR